MANNKRGKTTSTSPLISVIVPVYQTEKYLEKCLSSIASQTFQDFEVLCINDQSPDGSAKILEAYAAKDIRFKNILHEKNLGVGGARNTGLRLAKANYIASVDSDDFIEPEMLERAYLGTENETHDIVCFGFNKVNDAGAIISSHGFQKQIKNLRCQPKIFSTFNPAFWNKLWRKSLFIDNDIFFPLHIYCEDLATTPRVLAKTRSVHFIDENLYNYFIRDDSITFQINAKHLIDYIKVFDLLYEFLQREGLWYQYQSSFKSELVVTGLRFHSKCMMESKLPEKETTDYLRHILLLRESYIQSNPKLSNLSQVELLRLVSSNTRVETEEAEMAIAEAKKAKADAEISVAEAHRAKVEMETAKVEMETAKAEVKKAIEKMEMAKNDKAKAKKTLRSIRSSLSFKVGKEIVKGFAQPGTNTVLMPWKLFRVVLNWFDRKNQRARRR